MMRRYQRFAHGLLGALCALTLLATAPHAAAQARETKALPRPDLASLTFANLVVRIEGDEEIGFAEQDFRVFILEALRAAGADATPVVRRRSPMRRSSSRGRRSVDRRGRSDVAR
jgi:hypothetical protein